YEIDPHLQAKLFGRSDYRDVSVSDLADLMRDIESKVTRLPDGFGKDAFSHEQWNRIVDASVRVLAAMDTEKTAGPKFQEPVDGRFKTFYRLQRDCAALYDKVRTLAPDVVKRIGAAALVSVLFAGLIAVFPTVGIPAAVGAAVGIALYRYCTSELPSKQNEFAQINKLSNSFADSWNAQFAEKPDAALAPYRNMMLASSGTRISAELRRDLAARGYTTNETVLSGAMRRAFDTSSVKHANITLEKRSSDANKEKILINNAKHGSEGNDIGVGNQVITGFSNTNREKIILRRINQLHLDNIEMRRLNDRVMAQTGMLEKPPFSDRIN